MKEYLTYLKKPLSGLEKEVKKIIDSYALFNKNEKIIVALSGGKDSTSVLYILKKLGYNVEGLMIDLNLGQWSEVHKKNMSLFCKELKIKFHIVDLKKEFGQGICFIKKIVKEKKNLSGCTVCGVIKRWILNKWSKKLSADKIVTGHNLNDECQTILMNFLKGNLYLGINSTPMTGISKSEKINFSIKKNFAQRVKPLFFISESKIKEYSKKMNFPILYDRCPCAIGTYRVETRKWILEISDSDKLRIVNNFQKIIPKLKKKKSFGEIKNCKICGEPSRKDICNACEMFLCLK